MKLLGKNLKAGTMKLQVDSADDLWYLSHIIDPGDIVTGKTIRKIKLGEGSDRNTKIIKKPVFLSIAAEKIELQPDELRVSGKITEGPEDVSKGSYHTFGIEERMEFSIKKEQWLKYQLDKVSDACNVSVPKILIVVHDREEAYIAIMKKYGFEVLLHLQGDVEKKEATNVSKGGFYASLIVQLLEYDKRYGIERIVLASPAFFKEDLMKLVKDSTLKKKIVLATCNSVGKNGINEVLKREETQEALRMERTSQEMQYVEELLSEISKDGKAAYGMNEVTSVAESGAVANLLVTDGLIFDLREKGGFEALDAVMKLVDQTKGSVHIVSSQHEGGRRLDGLGGIGTILRYKV